MRIKEKAIIHQSEYNKIRKHLGHYIVCVGYALQDLNTGDRIDEYQNVAIECEDCNEVIMSIDNPKT